MKKSLWVAVLFSLAGCQFNQELKMRKSINRYLKEIHTGGIGKDYSIRFTMYSESDFITYLRKENNDNCDTTREERAATLLQHKATIAKGLPLTMTEIEYDTTAPTDVFTYIDDSLSHLKADPNKVYYKVFAYTVKDGDTTWKNTFWMDEEYKIVW